MMVRRDAPKREKADHEVYRNLLAPARLDIFLQLRKHESHFPFSERPSNYYTPAKQRYMTIKSLFAGALLISHISTSYGQTTSIIVPHGITLPKDSTTQSQLLAALNGFLSQKDKPAKENTYVLKG